MSQPIPPQPVPTALGDLVMQKIGPVVTPPPTDVVPPDAAPDSKTGDDASTIATPSLTIYPTPEGVEAMEGESNPKKFKKPAAVRWLKAYHAHHGGFELSEMWEKKPVGELKQACVRIKAGMHPFEDGQRLGGQPMQPQPMQPQPQPMPQPQPQPQPMQVQQPQPMQVQQPQQQPMQPQPQPMPQPQPQPQPMQVQQPQPMQVQQPQQQPQQPQQPMPAVQRLAVTLEQPFFGCPGCGVARPLRGESCPNPSCEFFERMAPPPKPRPAPPAPSSDGTVYPTPGEGDFVLFYRCSPLRGPRTLLSDIIRPIADAVLREMDGPWQEEAQAVGLRHISLYKWGLGKKYVAGRVVEIAHTLRGAIVCDDKSAVGEEVRNTLWGLARNVVVPEG